MANNKSYSIFTRGGANCDPETTGVVVERVLGYNCSKTIQELIAILGGRSEGSVRYQTTFENDAPLSEAFAVPYLFPVPMVLSNQKQISVSRDVAVQMSTLDLLMNPAPIMTDETDLGPDAFQSRQIPLTLGVGEADNFPFIQVPQYAGTPVQGTFAWQRLMPILGTIFRITWTENDDSSHLVFGRKYTNVVSSELEIARVIPQDENCRQLSFFVPFCSSVGEQITRGTNIGRYYPVDYLQFYLPGDQNVSDNPSLMPWYFQVIEGGAIKTTGYSWNVEAITIPVAADFLMKFWPIWDRNTNSFTKQLAG